VDHHVGQGGQAVERIGVAIGDMLGGKLIAGLRDELLELGDGGLVAAGDEYLKSHV